MIDVIKEIVMILTGCLTAFGGWELVRYLLNRKSNGRKADAEADYSEFKVLKETIEFMQEQFRLKEERFADTMAQLRDANRQLLEAEKKIGRLEAERSLKLCEVKKCGSREPFSGY